MSGWDVSSTPTWGPEDGPEEKQGFTGPDDGSRDHGQEFGAHDFGRGGPNSPSAGFPELGSGGFPGEHQAGGPPPEFLGQEYGQGQDSGPGGFPQRTPGQSLQDLPRREPRGRHSSASASGAYPQDNGFGQESAFGKDNGFGHEGGFGPGSGFGADRGFGQGNGFSQESALGHDGGPGRDGGYGQDDGFGRSNGFGRDGGYGKDDAFGQSNGFSQESAFGHDGGPGRDGGYGQDDGFGRSNGVGRDGGYGHDGFGQESDFGHDGGPGQNWGGGADQADGWNPGNQAGDGGWERAAGRSAAPWEESAQQDGGFQGPDGQEFGQQEFGRQDYPRQGSRQGFAQDYEGQEFPGQQGNGTQEAPAYGRREGDMSARMDPALSDFFGPERGGGSGGYPDQRPGRPSESRDRYRPSTSGWEDGGGGSRDPRGGTGPRPARRPLDDDEEPRRGLGMRGLIAIGVGVAVIIVIGVVLLTHKSGGSTPTASGSTPAGGTASTSAAQPSAGKAAGGTDAAATAAYTLSTPATAAGYPMGQDPHFLATATSTGKQIVSLVTSGGGGTVKGTPVSAAYMLPASQVITFVGYQGTFTPAKIETILGSLGSDPHTYPAGPNGGILGCANSTTTPSGAVCVWATTSTIGITEFFTATGPETLNAAQSKGASDTVNLRSAVEKKS